jgi:RNA polymerase sigma-32 factor
MIREATSKNGYLTPEEERSLFLAWRDRKDSKARERLILSHMPLAMKMARQQSGYGIEMDDVMGAAQVGLIRALDTFDPDRGARFSTLAYWTIKEDMNNHIIATSNLLRGPNTATSRSMFFNLRRIKAKLGLLRVASREDAQKVRDELVSKLPSAAGMELDAIMESDDYMSAAVQSIDAPVGSSDSGDGFTLGEVIADQSDGADTLLAEREAESADRSLLRRAIASGLTNERERHIFINRKMLEPPKTLEELSVVYHISRERIRQIEAKAFERVAREVKRLKREAEDGAAVRRQSWGNRRTMVRHGSAEHAPYVYRPSSSLAPARDVLQSQVRLADAVIQTASSDTAAQMRSEATRRGNETRGAARRHEVSLKAAATMRARRLETARAAQEAAASMTAAHMRSEATRRGNETRGAERRREVSLKAAATMRARRQAVQAEREAAATRAIVTEQDVLAQARSDATRRANETRGAERRRQISLKAAATLRARREAKTDSWFPTPSSAGHGWHGQGAGS